MTIVEGWALDCAIRRHWFRKPADENMPFPLLAQLDRNDIVAEALRIQNENNEQKSA